MKEKIKIILITGIIGTVFIIGIWQYQHQKYQEKMIKFDACLTDCPEGGASCYLPEFYNTVRCEEERICNAECREKYGMTWEDYNKWKND